MNMQEFKKLQTAQMEIMDEVHRICCENNIIYYIIGGTALGAIRHGGFIPWDLDMDIAMPRTDYERFAEICNYALSKRFIYKDYRNTTGFMHPHALICIRNTVLTIKNDKFNSPEKSLGSHGIYMDIFPLDIAPEDEKLQKKQISTINKIKKLILLKRAYRHGEDIKNSVIKPIVSKMIFWTDIDRLNIKFDKECRRYENTDSTLWCSMSSRYKYSKQCMSASIYGKPKLVKFEDREYFAPEMLEKYLEKIYGDYMKLPPESERNANLEIYDKVVFDN